MSNSAKRNIIFGSILIIVSVVIFVFMVFQVINQGTELEEQVAALQEERAQEASYFSLRRIAEESAFDRAQLHTYFLERESDSIDFLNTIERIAPEAGVILETNSLESVTSADQTQWVEATFAFSGSRDQVERFIQILESVPYVSRVTAINMSARSSTEWRASVTIQVRVLAYEE